MRNNKVLLIFVLLYLIQCSIIPPAKLPQEKSKFAQRVLIENFEKLIPGISVSPTGTENLFIKEGLLASDGWIVSQGPKTANKWIVSTAEIGYNSEKSVYLQWNNKNQVSSSR